MNHYNLNNKVAIVTGASRGIGKEIVKSLLLSGAKVALISRSSDPLKKVCDEFKSLGETIFFDTDVAKHEDIKQASRKIFDKWGKIDFLINNAGITNDKLLLRMSENDWDSVINTNLKGTFNCIKATLPYMLKNNSGKIVNITSVVGISGNPGQSNYCASKSGIIGLTKSIAKEYGKKSINVNAVAPGLIDTEMTKDINKDNFSNNITLNRNGKPEDISNLVCFLCSEDASYITGQVINVDGGLII